MAKLTDGQKDELAAFLDLLYAKGGYTTQKQWAVEADYHETNLSTAMNRAVPDGLSGYTLLKLIRAAAARATDVPDEVALRLSREAAGEQAMIALRLQALEDTVNRHTDVLTSTMRAVEALLGRIAGEQLPPAQTANGGG